jgi:hypothetical protein
MKELPCPTCGEGQLFYNQRATMDAWQHPAIFKLDDIGKLKDNIISEIMVMSCDRCDAENRLTFEEIEKMFREKLTHIILTDIAQGSMPDPGSLRHTPRIFYYCGKCGGFDGKGSCTKDIYNGCELKRLPYGF